jgi:dTDP-4-dehydrorhamnose reductase
MKYLITGRNGQLARSFIGRLEKLCRDCVVPDESLLDITDEKVVSEFVGAAKPGVIINCAAYNLVDKAEAAPAAAFAVNATGPQYLARAAAKHKAVLVHFGSDYVFDGMKERGPYDEDDATNPLNEYGKSKLAGERLVLEELDQCLILRLSWVFGPGKQNFIYKLSQWAGSNEYLRIACDEFSVPTYTETVVDVTLKALDRGLTGRHHLTNSGFCSRYEWAKLILESLGIEKFIRPVTMDFFQLPAKRPQFSAMSNDRLARLLDLSIPAWDEGVRSFLKEGGLTREE